MSRPIIAVDIDEVLAQHNATLVEWYNQKFGANFKLDDYFTAHWSQVWGTDHALTEQRAQQFHQEGMHGTFNQVVGAHEALKQLRQSHDLVAVTVRRQLIVPLTHEWLTREFPGVFADVHFVPFWDADSTITKADICKQIGATFLVDDSLEHCRLVAQAGIGAVLFGDYPWNKAETLPAGVVRAVDWPATLKVIYG